MFFKQIETKSLAHYSYMIGDGDDIAVIDPMRDVSVYMHEARKSGMRIKYILETHRNEDYVIGYYIGSPSYMVLVWMGKD